MKKQELIHLHGLLAEVSDQYEQWTGDRPAMTEYDSLGVRPTSIHKSKTDHKAAVFAIADGIVDEVEDAEERAVSATAD